MSPALIASRITTSSRFFAEAAPKHLGGMLACLSSEAIGTGEHCVTRIEEALRTPHSEESVFFYIHLAKRVQIAAIPREMGMGIS
jgi:hypothetical protein